MKKHVLAAAVAVWGVWQAHASEESQDTKKQYTRTLFVQNQKTIQDQAKELHTHDMYAMLGLLHVGALKATVSWNVVDFLLQTAGHWGWGTSQTANATETLIYREAAICRFWEEPKLAVPATAPAFLSKVKEDADKWVGINNNIKLSTKLPGFGISFENVSFYRKRELSNVLSYERSNMFIGKSLYATHDEYILREYLHVCSALFYDPSGNSLHPDNRRGCYARLNEEACFLLKSYFVPLDYSNIKDDNWYGVLYTKNSGTIMHYPGLFAYPPQPGCTGWIHMDSRVHIDTPGYHYVKPNPPAVLYAELQQNDQIIDIEPPALKTFLTR